MNHIILECGGVGGLVTSCRQRSIPLNLGSAPLLCLVPLRQPAPSKLSLSLAKWGPVFLVCVKVSALSVDLIYLALDFHQSGYYLDVDNIHYILSIPAGTSTLQ